MQYVEALKCLGIDRGYEELEGDIVNKEEFVRRAQLELSKQQLN